MGAIDNQLKALLDGVYDNTLAGGATFGQSVSVTLRTQGNYNTTTGKVTPTDSAKTAQALISQFSADQIANSGGLIQRGDLAFKIRKSDDIPSINKDDLIAFGGKTFRILNVDQLWLGGALYEFMCQGRR